MWHCVKVGRVSHWVFWTLPLLLLLHQNVWMWSDDTLFAGLPVNLAYHLFLCLLVTLLMLFVVKYAWPDYPDDK
jgi:hypothetical protein